MHILPKITLLALTALTASTGLAQTAEETEQLQLAALEALMMAPEERALPLVRKILAGDYSEDVKSRALFVLSQIDFAEARTLLIEAAKTSDTPLQHEAIRMIGIDGDAEALAELAEIYQAGDSDVRESVLHAYMIADDSSAVYEIAASAVDEKEFEDAVQMLGMMGATDELKMLSNREGSIESLIQAYAISGDFDSLYEIAMNGADDEQKMQAIQSLGMVGDDRVDAALLDIYRGADSTEIKEAALHGMMMSDSDDVVLELYRASDNAEEKQSLLRMLVMMDSDAAMDAIDAAFGGDQ